MILKWSDYLKIPFNKDYDTNAAALQKLILFSETAENSSRHLNDNKTIICVTKDAFDGHLQATYNHTIKRASFTQVNPDCLALTRFGERATAVKMDPKEMFKHPKSKKAAPKFRELLACRTVDDVRFLQVSQNKVNVDCYAIFPPAFTEELFDKDNVDPVFIILKIINKINLLYAIQFPDEIDLTGEKAEKESDTDKDDEKVDENVGAKEDEPHPMEDSYARIIYFLYFTTVSSNSIESTKLMVCTKSTTTIWCEQQHNLCLETRK